jgi:hypothetical protein
MYQKLRGNAPRRTAEETGKLLQYDTRTLKMREAIIKVPVLISAIPKLAPFHETSQIIFRMQLLHQQYLE